MGDKLDFLVIGAQKAGTTSLWHYLRGHPQLYLAPDKEAAFFTDTALYKQGIRSYIKEFFPKPPQGVLLGTITPPYMTGTADVPVEVVVERIHHTLPDARLIAILRDPIERAISHFRMSQRRGMETRSFAEAVETLLDPVAAQEARERPTETNSYLTAGEYGRILGHYRRLFPADRVLVLYTNDLRHRRPDLVRELLRFLGVDDAWPGVDSDQGEYFVSGSRRRVSVEAEEALYHHLITEIYPLMPEDVRDAAARSFGFFFASWNVVPDDNVPPLPPEARSALRHYFETDVHLLHKLGIEAPSAHGSSDTAGAQISETDLEPPELQVERLTTRIRELELALEESSYPTALPERGGLRAAASSWFRRLAPGTKWRRTSRKAAARGNSNG